jgi:chaperonin GroEL
MITNDGKTIAMSIRLKDEFEDLGAQTVIEAALKTDDRAGDGTTTTVILASETVSEYAEIIGKEDQFALSQGKTGGADVNAMASEILDIKKQAIEYIKKEGRPLKKGELRKVIATSIGVIYPEHVDMLTEVVEKAGVDGFIDVTENFETQYGLIVEQTVGSRFLGSYATPFMITNPNKWEAVIEKSEKSEGVPVLVCNHTI